MENNRPAFVTEEHLEFLDQLRESAVTNMYHAVPFLVEEYRDLSEDEAWEILRYWMRTFSERHPQITHK